MYLAQGFAVVRELPKMAIVRKSLQISAFSLD